MLVWTIWPIVIDPERSAEPVRSGVRLGALLVLAHPIRMGLMAIITFAAAYVSLVAAHFVLPSADRLEGRETMIIEL